VSAFPADQPLTKRLPSTATLAYLQCASPVCAIGARLLKSATAAMGIKFAVIDGGGSVTTLQAAMNTIIAMKPTGVMLAGIDPTGIGDQIKQLVAEGVVVGSVGVMGTSAYGVQAPFNTEAANTKEGALLAAYVVNTKGAKAASVIYEVPELSFSPIVTAGYIDEMKTLCPECEVRKVDIPLASIGVNASSLIVSDLQSHPETNVAVFSDLDDETGLPAALAAAGISVETAGLSPSPSGLQDIKNGDLNATIAVDLPVMFWTGVDMIARIATGQPLTAGEKAGIPSGELLQKADITFDPSSGFSGYPNYAQRFAALWKG
jgi:ribose transport system substrate-binding protein